MRFDFPFLFLAFSIAMTYTYTVLREDADTLDRRALSGAIGAGMAVVVVGLLIFWMLGILR
ncbi:hypothetical protein M8J71_10060 [Pseudarthrobacter sp. R1]|uniref:hypothetical protein n=1 Tax=Pseudarthrobacter sp. R1 TaxID=2944934 RepID=UPI002108E8A7|nr:hypothetical protein [Pseudarthrobacter sp. R1]MCQ6270824.1 hypothetical protein [Pseudarthrobacter sp. R1]